MSELRDLVRPELAEAIERFVRDLVDEILDPEPVAVDPDPEPQPVRDDDPEPGA